MGYMGSLFRVSSDWNQDVNCGHGLSWDLVFSSKVSSELELIIGRIQYLWDRNEVPVSLLVGGQDCPQLSETILRC